MAGERPLPRNRIEHSIGRAVFAVALLIACGLSPSRAGADSGQFALSFKGFNYVSYCNGAFEAFDSLPTLASVGPNAVAVTVEYGIDVNDSTVVVDSNYTDVNGFGPTIAQAKSLGLSVMARPLIDFLDPAIIGSYSVAEYRSYYNPTDVAKFFKSYASMISSVAATAQANGADILCIGVELDQLTGPAYQSQWQSVIQAARSAGFTGQLVYSAEWDDNLSPWQYGGTGLSPGTGNIATQVSFWNQLDYVGLDWYAPISDAASPTHDRLIAGWTQVPTDSTSLAVTGNQSLISYVEGVATQLGMPIILTELGYESATDAASQPVYTSTNVFDPTLQADLYQAFFTAWQQNGDNSLVGVYFWNWDPDVGEVGPNNGANFSPQELPAQQVMTTNFGFPLSVSVSGKGKVKSSPAGISCGPTCSAYFASETEVGLIAIPASGWTFHEWRGACAGRKEHDCHVTISAATSVIAKFKEE
jgi:hypothetical protein